ncbi:hypothetical protein BDZ97DRAFT_1919029 [Flammula alnicola]|nr:hypothetical protein BDZ97DRAFT_1919029 [Flammula alnicola]
MTTRRLNDFQIPLTFPGVRFLRSGESDVCETRSVLEESLSNSRPTVLEHWGPLSVQAVHESEGGGIVFGCQDGTVYVLHRVSVSTPTSTDPEASQINESVKPTNPTRVSKSSHSNSRSTSPTVASFALSPTFNVTAKPRVVSGITVEQVEAPKNYVDFEDEPDKLKDILKGRNPRERHSFSDTGSEKAPKSTAGSIVEPVPPSKRKNQVSRSLLSAANSRCPTPPPFSVPGSPRECNSASPSDTFYAWALRYHIIPSHSGFGHAIKAIRFLHDDHFFAVLQENGALYVYSSDDGSCAASIRVDEEVSSSSGIKERAIPRDKWLWCNLAVLCVEDSVVLVAMAENKNDASALTSDASKGSSETSRCVLLEIITTPSDVQLRRLGQWDLNGPANGDNFYEGQDGNVTFFSTSHDGHFITREFELRPSPTPVKATSSTENENNHHYGPHLPIPNPFKAMMSHSTEHLLANEDRGQNSSEDAYNAYLSEARDLGILVPCTALSGLRTRRSDEGNLLGIAWTHGEIAVFEHSGQTLSLFFRTSNSGIEDVEWLDHGIYALSFEDHVEVYRMKTVDADNEEVDSSKATIQIQPELIRKIHVGPHETIKFGPNSFVLTKFSEDIQQVILYSFSAHEDSLSPQGASHILWQAKAINLGYPTITLTSMLPLELELIIQGYSDGLLRRFSLAQMARQSEKSSTLASASMKTSNLPLGGHVVGLHVVQNNRTRERYIVGGGDDGSIAFWSLTTFELVARWTTFITPLAKVIQFEADKTGPLRGCALCISRDGSIAVIVIDGFHFLYLIPGSTASLKRICLGGNNLLLIYSDHRVRLWDAQTKELWRSMGQEKAEELLAQGGWSELTLEKDACVPKTYWSHVAGLLDGQDAASSLNLNLEKLIVDSISVTKTISTSRDEVREILLTLDRLRLILSALLTPGLSTHVDSICYEKLGAYPSSALAGLASPGTTTLYDIIRPQDVWCLSSNATASRALAIIAVLRAMSLFEELTDGANAVISFFTTSLGPCVGPRFKPPSLEFLGKLWFEASNEFRQPIRTLFEATISNLSDEDSVKVAEKWQHHVPSLQPDAEKETMNAALALLICGCVASEKYSLLSINALMDISKSISLYLNDEKSIYRVLAIDLCSRGFNVWQHYIDAMEILRSMFDLATSVRKDSISIQNVGAQARLAVLSIAAGNMPLFMGTLCLDILTPPTMEHRRSVLQVLAFLIRKRPYVLQPNLPRLMEAVVKSLDPNSTSDRDLVLDTATEIIGYVVKTLSYVYSRLAVGTNEGAVVMYDLKTAIRLYVLEGHKKPITALSFSPDGRRLVTISLKESVVLAWKVGSSFASFFNPGAPPRQGHGGSQPFKTLNFNIGSEANISTAETLDLVRVEWVTDRSVKVKIRHSVLTFST